jgi:hypothetical protein
MEKAKDECMEYLESQKWNTKARNVKRNPGSMEKARY